MNGKKLIAMLLLVITILSASSAFAATEFEWDGWSTTTFFRWGPSQTSTGSNWHITWDSDECNMEPDLRAAVRIYANPGEYASSIFVYSNKSSAYHPYRSGYGNGGCRSYIAGRVDNRDYGHLFVAGTFHN